MMTCTTLASIGYRAGVPLFALEYSMAVIYGVIDGKDRGRAIHSCIRHSRKHAPAPEV